MVSFPPGGRNLIFLFTFYMFLSVLGGGHARTSSEISVSGSEESSSCGGNGGHMSILNQTEVDRLLRKLSEMNEVLEAREAKLVETSKANMELMEKNTDLTRYVEVIFKKKSYGSKLFSPLIFPVK